MNLAWEKRHVDLMCGRDCRQIPGRTVNQDDNLGGLTENVIEVAKPRRHSMGEFAQAMFGEKQLPARIFSLFKGPAS